MAQIVKKMSKKINNCWCSGARLVAIENHFEHGFT